MLTNAEIWYNLTNKEILELESVDKLFFTKLLEVPGSTPIESYYLELGVLPMGAIIKARRVTYLHSILEKAKATGNSMLYSCFITQWHNPSPGDWTEQIKLD